VALSVTVQIGHPFTPIALMCHSRVAGVLGWRTIVSDSDHAGDEARARILWGSRATMGAEVPFHESRLIIARMLHDVMRFGHGAFTELPFIQAVEITMIATAILMRESDGQPFTTLGLATHLQMPRATLIRRLSFLASKGIIRRDARALRINPRIFASPIRDEAIRRLRQIVIDAGTALSEVDT